MTRENRIVTKAVRGPGGIDCPCCRARISRGDAKKLHRRILRRRAITDIRRAVEGD